MDNKKADILKQLPFNTDVEVEKRWSEHWQLFNKYKDHRNQTIRFFNKNGKDRKIIDYVKDSVDRMNEYHLKPGWKEDWQSNVFDPKTRDKLIAILSVLAGSRMKAELQLDALSIHTTRGMEDRKNIYQGLLDYANYHNDDQYQLVWELYTAMTQGTVIGYESWKKDTRTVEYVTEFDDATGKTKTEKVTYDAWDDVFGEIVPIEEFYPENIWVNAKEFKEKVHRAFRVQSLTYAGFRDIFAKFKNADTVQPRSFYINMPGFDWGISSDVDPENVEVVYFFDEIADRLGIWANGVEIYYGPMPWNHKKLPFWVAIFEPINERFLYGKSLPDKLMGMQDINNAVWNGILDQLFLALNSPVFIDGMIDDLSEGHLEPGGIYEIAPGAKAQRFAMGQVDQASTTVLSLLQRSMEESTISAQAQGVPTGGRKTKFEVQQLNQAAMNIASLALQLMEYAMRNKYWLRMYNVLQFYSMPSQTKSGKQQFKYLVVEDTQLPNGKTGKKMIQIVGSESDLPKEDAMRDMMIAEGGDDNVLESRVQPVVITRDYLMNREFDLAIRIVPNSSVKQTEADKRNKDIAFYQVTQNNPMIDQEKNVKDFVRAFGKSDELVKKPGMAEAVNGAMSGLPGMSTGMQGMPAPQNQPMSANDMGL